MNYKTDFLIVGAGISGLTLAIKLAEKLPNENILIITKEEIRECNTYYAQGGMACVWNEEDSFEKHIQDTLTAGDGLCDEEIVRKMLTNVPERMKELINWGVNFTKNDDGSYDLGREGGHSERRVLHVNDLTGRYVEEALIKKVQTYRNIEIKENWCGINLYSRDLKCYGLYTLDQNSDIIYNISAKATILATGGAGKIYLYTTNPDVASGDGIAMAYRANAKIANMEFFQFHPTCLYHPYAKSLLITEAMRGEGAILKDIQGKKFMEKYHPMKELAPRDIVSRAIDAELKKSGDDYVLLDIASQRENHFIKEHFPGVYEKCLGFNIDITQQPIPVVPAAHYCCGGVVANIDGSTQVKNLYVIGESSCTGLHGANRLASNSLIEGLVCAHNCAQKIISEKDAMKILEFKPWEPGNAIPSTEAVVITQNWEEVRRIMQNYVGIVRTDRRLQRAKKRINLILDEIDRYYWDFKIEKDLIELRNLATVAKIIIVSAISRKESRGIHYNIDHLKTAKIARPTVIERPW
ncbi:MAG: L-aspartate oxidase [Candidatus Lokiarchaeota archaeon]|nr:L-aspartate oxidase [Candidatus Lokiarchaeota archaeon]MBD3200279.1 L-aspartate oxidase [Candidatus Lokiarchaeota archaeon]